MKLNVYVLLLPVTIGQIIFPDEFSIMVSSRLSLNAGAPTVTVALVTSVPEVPSTSAVLTIQSSLESVLPTVPGTLSSTSAVPTTQSSLEPEPLSIPGAVPSTSTVSRIESSLKPALPVMPSEYSTITVSKIQSSLEPLLPVIPLGEDFSTSAVPTTQSSLKLVLSTTQKAVPSRTIAPSIPVLTPSPVASSQEITLTSSPSNLAGQHPPSLSINQVLSTHSPIIPAPIDINQTVLSIYTIMPIEMPSSVVSTQGLSPSSEIPDNSVNSEAEFSDSVSTQTATSLNTLLPTTKHTTSTVVSSTTNTPTITTNPEARENSPNEKVPSTVKTDEVPDQMLISGITNLDDEQDSNTNNSSTSCVTPSGENGTCGHLRDCPSYSDLSDNFHKPDIIAFLRSRICRILPRQIFLCCPNAA